MFGLYRSYGPHRPQRLYGCNRSHGRNGRNGRNGRDWLYRAYGPDRRDRRKRCDGRDRYGGDWSHRPHRAGNIRERKRAG